MGEQRWDERPFRDLVKTADNEQLRHMAYAIKQEQKSRRNWFERRWPLVALSIVWLLFSPWTLPLAVRGRAGCGSHQGRLLKEYGSNLPFHHSSELRGLRHGGYVDSGRSRWAGPSVSFTPLTPCEHPSCSSAATRRATTGYTRSTYRWPTTSTMSIWRSCARRG